MRNITKATLNVDVAATTDIYYDEELGCYKSIYTKKHPAFSKNSLRLVCILESILVKDEQESIYTNAQ